MRSLLASASEGISLGFPGIGLFELKQKSVNPRRAEFERPSRGLRHVVEVIFQFIERAIEFECRGLERRKCAAQ